MYLDYARLSHIWSGYVGSAYMRLYWEKSGWGLVRVGLENLKIGWIRYNGMDQLI
jgi:hypothetical protein